MVLVCLFFFKQKTAYEMRISDWSSDVCSSDLLCDVKPHVLRYWETEFGNLNPVKRRGNRRYYQRHDVLMIRQIRALLYEEGYTIGGARQRLEGDRKSVASGRRVSVRVDLGWRRTITKKATNHHSHITVK